MAERDTSRDIDEAASNWTARLDRGPLTPEEDQAFQSWLKGDPRSRGALLRAQSLFMMSESAQALGTHYDPADFREPTAPRRGLSRRGALLWAGGAGAAASLAALAVGVPAAGAVTSTRRGEIRLVPLKDGSTVLLNTDSRIRVRYGRNERFVALVRGEAYFSVARDERPFVVEVDGRRLRTSQAGFRVRKLAADPVDLLVQQGRVDVTIPRLTAPAANLALDGNTRLVMADLVPRPQPITPAVVTRELAWREGKLAFEGESLKEAAEAFARYSDTRIAIPDPTLAREPVAGLFAANDPVGFSRAIARVFDARLDHKGDLVVLSRASAPTGASN
ncbi:FecR family protein [Caulobacter endophyticus]|uniref:FecR family protein n=1 Tax=Caulobacter endophyticus TaxID=2172652 RepID=UPI00240EFDC9|nr:FecR domain-containing protein [Caulobacter endophyticus]MDG2530710.1 FecR domain-containing protein [Caulobacter endophyticus]